MTVGELLRTARRHAGLSQRDMAAAAGVPVSSLAGAEAGTTSPRWPLVEAVLAVAGLEVGVERRAAPAGEDVRQHLHLSLSERLYLALGGRLETRRSMRSRPHPAAWEALSAWSRRGRLTLTGRSALGLWLPDAEPVREVGSSSSQAPSTAPAGAVRLARRDDDGEATVSVPLLVGVLWTPPPAVLALDPDVAERRTALRAAASALDAGAAKDLLRRRRAAHREPERAAEEERARWSGPWSEHVLPPDRLDGRGWRLRDVAGHAVWLEVAARRR